MPQFLLDLTGNVGNYYSSFERPKRSGGYRKISASRDRLKRIQRLFLDEFLTKYQLPPHVHGCIKHRSTATNAKEHVNQEVVINLDLSNFFGTISSGTVEAVLESRFNCDKDAASVLAKLMTLNECLPQGAPSSPFLANLAALDLDDAIIGACHERLGPEKFRYTRYVDDITISGSGELVDLLPDFDRIIIEQGFQSNVSKSRILRQSTRQWVTGLVVNKRLTVPKKFLRYVRQQLYYCKRYGLEAHCDWRGLPPNVFVRQMRGSIGYIRMSQPGVADRFEEVLDLIDPELAESDDELKLKLVKKIIDEERTAKFLYENTARKGGFAEIIIDDDGIIQVRGFQVSPEIGWRLFLFSQIGSLEIEAHVS